MDRLPLRFQALILVFVPCVIASTHSPSPSPTFNSISESVVETNRYIHTKILTQIPDEDGSPAKINSIVSYRLDLYITTLTRIYKIYPYVPSPSPILLLDLRDAISKATSGERELDTSNSQHGGLRSVAFAPRSRSGRFYVTAMETRPANVSDFRYVSDVPNPIDADSVLLEFRSSYENIWESYRVVFRVGMPVFDHTIRTLMYGSDGMLYISHGDGSLQDGAAGGGLNADGLGKILRIDPQRRRSRLTGTWVSYTVPLDNPFVDSSDMIPEVFALGFRNPHHICFNRDGNTLYVAETGRANVEEVNLVEAGGNYGWSQREGIFVHAGGGLGSGIRPLPEDDEQYEFIYPAALLGHYGPWAAAWVGQAIGGGCPVENGSAMSGQYWYTDFPVTGKLYFSRIRELKNAVTKGSPDKLTQASTRKVSICFHDGSGNAPRKSDDLSGVLKMDPGFEEEERVDVRMGRGPQGELYWSSKRNGKVYAFLSSMEGEQPKGRCGIAM